MQYHIICIVFSCYICVNYGTGIIPSISRRFRGWVEDDEDERVRAISRRVAAMTGLDLSYAEPFQVRLM